MSFMSEQLMHVIVEERLAEADRRRCARVTRPRPPLRRWRYRPYRTRLVD